MMSSRNCIKNRLEITSNALCSRRNHGDCSLKRISMRFTCVFAVLISISTLLSAQDHTIRSQPKLDAAAAHFDTVLQQSLATLKTANGFAVEVDSTWNAKGDQHASLAGSYTRLISAGGRYRVEVQSKAASSPDLICVNDGTKVTTYYPARKIYSQHALNEPEASLAGNKMLAMSLQGSAVDILLQPDVAGFVHSQASALTDGGDSLVDGQKAHHFELLWAGAKVGLDFAAEGQPLLLQFTRTTVVPAAMGQHYTQVCTAKFKWRLNERPSDPAFVLAVPSDGRRVNEIYDALSGDDAAGLLDQPLPKVTLARLDGADFNVVADTTKKATVFIFWATWCAASVEDLPAVHKFVAEYKDRGVAFYAVNVGEAPGAVRRFTDKHPLVSSVVLDPRSSLSSALRIQELPAVVIAGPDNAVRAILHGDSKELQGELAAHLQSLITGGTTTARRSESPARAK
jgi:thiol-disulfide isomerase/thioredoxin